jgi:methanogenic corrinoid protein MtbC1
MTGHAAKDASLAIYERRAAIAEAVTARHYERFPELLERFGERGRARCLQDAHFHLAYLCEALATSLPSLFADYVAWAKIMLEQRGVTAADLAGNLEVLRETLAAVLPAATSAPAIACVDAGLARLPDLPSDLPPVIVPGEPLAELAQGFLDALLAGDRRAASRLVLDAVDAGTSVKDVYLHVFQPSQREIGRLWQTNRISVAQEHFSTAATQLVMSQLYPHVFSTEKNGLTLVATCAAENLHEIGVRMVSDFFEIEGWDTFYLGANAPVTDVVRTLAERRADVLAVSATMTSHLRAVGELVAAARATEGSAGVKILVGGNPFNAERDLWRAVGADGVAHDAAEAVAVANRLVGREGA